MDDFEHKRKNDNLPYGSDVLAIFDVLSLPFPFQYSFLLLFELFTVGIASIFSSFITK